MFRRIMPIAVAAALFAGIAWAADDGLIPPQLPKAQKENLMRFLQKHEKASRYVPEDAKIIGTRPNAALPKTEAKAGQPIKQYAVQVISHRPVPDQPVVTQADVYYYRPNPEKGKQGITVKRTVDLTTGEQVGPTEVLLNRHTPISREELQEAVDMAKQKAPGVKNMYQDREPTTVRWEYLQLLINHKHGPHEPGDRAVRLAFTSAEGGEPVRVVVNLTKGVVTQDN